MSDSQPSFRPPPTCVLLPQPLAGCRPLPFWLDDALLLQPIPQGEIDLDRNGQTFVRFDPAEGRHHFRSDAKRSEFFGHRRQV